MRQEPTLEPGAAPVLRAEPRALPARRARSGRLVRRLLCSTLLLALASPLLTIVALRWLPPPTTAFMLQSPTRPVRYQWVPASEIAGVARKAVVAAEDQKFWTHEGFDLEAIEKAYAHNKKGKRQRRGASTITQQTAKNLFLWPGGGYFRKGVEAGFTVLIEALWSKDRILEVYLNVAEFGPGIYGVEAAAQAFFGKPARALSAGEAARLAAVLPSPRRWSARAPGPYVQRRAAWILGQMGHGARSVPQEEPEIPESGAEALIEEEPAPAAGAGIATEPELEAIPVPEDDAAAAPADPFVAPAPPEPETQPEPTAPPAADKTASPGAAESEAAAPAADEADPAADPSAPVEPAPDSPEAS